MRWSNRTHHESTGTFPGRAASRLQTLVSIGSAADRGSQATAGTERFADNGEAGPTTVHPTSADCGSSAKRAAGARLSDSLARLVPGLFEAELPDGFAHRLGKAFVVIIAANLALGLADFWLEPDRPGPLWYKFAQIVAMLVGLRVLRARPGSRAEKALALVALLIVVVLSTASGTALRDPFTTPIPSVVLVTGAASFLSLGA